MNHLDDLLTPDAVRSGVVPGSKKKLFALIGEMAGTTYGLEPAMVADRLSAREKLGSTGFGGGIAIPHGKVAGLDRVVGIFIRLDKPLDFAAVDDLRVDLVFALLSPPTAGPEHLKALARISRRLRDRAFTDKLRGAASADAIYALLAGSETRDAA